MPRAGNLPVSFVVEGDTVRALVEKLAASCRVDVHDVYVRGGKPGVLKGLVGFNNSARSRPWFVLLDLDQDELCAGNYVRRILPAPSRQMGLRLAVRSVEAWLLADRVSMARFLGVKIARVPENPESLPDPKRTLLDSSRHSRRPIVRDGLPPQTGSGRSIGALYVSLIVEFTSERWNVEAARRNCPSLDRAIKRLEELARGS